jgi:hypothetical protein
MAESRWHHLHLAPQCPQPSTQNRPALRGLGGLGSAPRRGLRDPTVSRSPSFLKMRFPPLLLPASHSPPRSCLCTLIVAPNLLLPVTSASSLSPPHSRSLSSPLLSLHSRCRSQPLTLFSEQSRFSDDDFLHCNFRVSVLVSLSAQGVIQGTGVISFVIYSEA